MVYSFYVVSFLKNALIAEIYYNIKRRRFKKVLSISN